jgi:hypothetical protein
MTAPPPLRGRWLEHVTHRAEAGEVTGPAVAVAAALWSFLNGTGECWPAAPTLAARAGVSVKSARRHLHALEAAGLLEVRPRSGGPSMFRVLLDPLQDPGHSDQGGQSDHGQSDQGGQRDQGVWSEGPGTLVTVTTEPDQEPDQEPADVSSFRARTNVRAHATPGDNPSAAARPEGQGSLWLQPVEAPATPAEGVPAHPLAARAAAASRRPAKITNSTVLCRCGHSLKDHNSRAVKVGGKRTGDRDTSCTFCACAALDTVPRAERAAALAAAKAAATA